MRRRPPPRAGCRRPGTTAPARCRRVDAERVLGQRACRSGWSAAAAEPARDQDGLALDVVPLVVVVDQASAEPEARLRDVEVARVARPPGRRARAGRRARRGRRRRTGRRRRRPRRRPRPRPWPRRRRGRACRRSRRRGSRPRTRRARRRPAAGATVSVRSVTATRTVADLGQRLGLGRAASAARQRPVDRQVLGVGRGRLAAPVAGVVGDLGAGGSGAVSADSPSSPPRT